MLKNGFIVLHRKMTNWEWYKDYKTLIVFLHLILTANYEEKRFQGKLIKRGQRVVGRKILAEETGLSEQSVRTAILHLKSTNEVTSEKIGSYTVYTVVNYDLYQTRDQQTNQLINQQTNQLINHNETKNNKDNNPLNPPQGEDDVRSFEIFWSAYPKKYSLKQSKELYLSKHFNDVQKEYILKVLEEDKQSEDWQKEGGRYIPTAYRWLEDERYNRPLRKNKAPSWSCGYKSVREMMEEEGEL